VPYDFFFSYPRAVKSPYLKKFFTELHEAVRMERGLPEGTVVGFYDETDLERGTDWPEEIKNALQTTKTIVPIYCAAYFKGTFCERELQIFEERQKLWLKSASVPALAPRVIKPIPWLTGFEVPTRYKHIQYSTGSALESEGLYHVRSNRGSYKKAYGKFIEKLAKDIVATADSIELPPLPSLPPMIDDGAAEQVPVSVGIEEGPGHVEFVYIAGTSTEVAGLRSHVEHYGRSSRMWKPFLPDEARAIGPLSQGIASEINFSSGELPASITLAKQIREAEDRGNLVIVIVDGWATKLANYKGTLAYLDHESRLYLNCSVIVPWSKDPETIEHRSALAQSVRDTLRRWAKWATGSHTGTRGEEDQTRFSDHVASADDFRLLLRHVLTRLKADVMNSSDALQIPPYPKPNVWNTRVA
jgi:FxsC-like protein